MFKFVVLSCLVSVAFAGYVPASIAVEKTIVQPHHTVVETPYVKQVGANVHTYPSAHSYQSQTQYHSKTVAEPIIAHGVQKSIISTPVIKEVVEHVPAKIVAEPIYAKQYVAAPQYIAAPQPYYAKTIISEPTYAKTIVAAPQPIYAKTVVASPLSYSAPLTYASYPASYPATYAHHY